MRVIFCSLIVVLISHCLNVEAATNLKADTLWQLVQLENKFFAHSFDNDTDEHRVSRLEEYILGGTRAGDPAQRIKNIIASTSSDSITDGESASYGGSVAAPDDKSTNDVFDSYPHVTSLENTILGQSYVGQSVSDRLARMETKAFGAPSNNTDLSQRTDALESYAEKKLHKKPLVPEENRESASASPQSGSQQGSGISKGLAAMVGNSLLGMLGIGVNGIGPPFGPPLLPSLGDSDTTTNGAGGGMHRRSHQMATEHQASENTNMRGEDPLVSAPNPPPRDAKMLIKVGWCEMQIFGQTFPKMHLPERLDKLNSELNFEPGKPGVDLMDDVDKMIKTVQAYKHAAPTF